MNSRVDIMFLKDRPAFSDEVAGLWYMEWGNSEHDDDLDRKQLSVRKNAQKGKIPFVLIALIGDELVGSASAFENDLLNRPELSPWLAAVVTKQKYRELGVAEQLTGAVISECKKLGYQRVYLRTEKADKYFSRLGWKLLDDTVDEKGLPTRIFTKGI